MIGQECIDELADYAGIKPAIAAITERAMHGELDFAAALRERVALLEGLAQGAIAQCLAERVRPNPGAATLVGTMRARGAMTLLVSGGFTAFAEPVAALLGFERVEANVLGTDNVDCQLGDGLPPEVVLGLPDGRVVAVGTGQAIKNAQNGDGDVATADSIEILYGESGLRLPLPRAG